MEEKQLKRDRQV